MKVYVSELPKDCIECPCESEYYCNLLNEDVGCCEWGEIHKNCPLQSLTDYTKQVRNEVCEKIREKLSLHCDYKENIGWYMTENKFNLILDQIENENV